MSLSFNISKYVMQLNAMTVERGENHCFFCVSILRAGYVALLLLYTFVTRLSNSQHKHVEEIC